MDGEPFYPGVITFQPAQGRASRAKLTPEGEYELIYLRDIEGAKIGRHTVRIGNPSEEDERLRGEGVPAQYNTETTLTAEVEPGQNTIDFALKSAP